MTDTISCASLVISYLPWKVLVLSETPTHLSAGCGGRAGALAVLRDERDHSYGQDVCWSRLCKEAVWCQHDSQWGVDGECPESLLQGHQNRQDSDPQVDTFN